MPVPHPDGREHTARRPETASQRALDIRPDAIPATLTAGVRFVGWRYEDAGTRIAKMPYAPADDDPRRKASVADPTTWMTFNDALAYFRAQRLDGIGRMFSPEDGLVGIDLDHCRDQQTGKLDGWAAAIVRRLDTYTEVSPSGTGVKLWAGVGPLTLPPQGRKRGGVEMYDRGRFFTLTGHHLDGTPPDVTYRPDAVLAIHREFISPEPSLVVAASPPADLSPSQSQGLPDEEVLRRLRESRRQHGVGRRLLDGDTSDYVRGGNDGESEADAALCEMLAFYGGPDRAQIERLWRQSGLWREDKPGRRDDYVQATLDFVLRGKTRFSGTLSPAAAPGDGGDGALGWALVQPFLATAVAAPAVKLAAQALLAYLQQQAGDSGAWVRINQTKLGAGVRVSRERAADAVDALRGLGIIDTRTIPTHVDGKPTTPIDARLRPDWRQRLVAVGDLDPAPPRYLGSPLKPKKSKQPPIRTEHAAARPDTATPPGLCSQCGANHHPEAAR